MFKLIKKFINFYLHVVLNEIYERRTEKYTIASEYFNPKDQVFYATLTVKGLSKPITKKVRDFYNKDWLSKVNSEDAARLAFLTYLENSGNLDIYKSFLHRKTRITKYTLFLTAFFIASLVVSNITGFKIMTFNILGQTLNIPAALIFFPFTYIFDSTITEVYGFAVSRIIIWGGLLASLLVTLGLQISVHTQPAEFWGFQESYALIFSHPPRIMAASFVAYFIGEFLNSYIISKMKILTNGKYYALRLITSTSVGAFFDSIIFCSMAFYGVYPNDIILQMIALQYVFKVGYEVIALPVTYFVTGYLKLKDKIDYYDIETDYNPFSVLSKKSLQAI